MEELSISEEDDDIVINIDDEVRAQATNVPDLTLCTSSHITVSVHDFKSLAPETYLIDSIIDFSLEHHHANMPLEKQEDVLILHSQFYVSLSNKSQKQTDILAAKSKYSYLWQDNGPKVVLVPVCKGKHWFLLVAVLKVKPLLLVLNSIDNYETMAAARVRDFLVKCRKEKGEAMQIIHPDVPLQPNGYDCGLFVITYGEKVMDNVDNFINMIFGDDGKLKYFGLVDWFPSTIVSRKREQVAALITEVTEVQGRSSNVPHINFNEGKSCQKIEPMEVATNTRETCPWCLAQISQFGIHLQNNYVCQKSLYDQIRKKHIFMNNTIKDIGWYLNMCTAPGCQVPVKLYTYLKPHLKKNTPCENYYKADGEHLNQAFKNRRQKKGFNKLVKTEDWYFKLLLDKYCKEMAAIRQIKCVICQIQFSTIKNLSKFPIESNNTVPGKYSIHMYGLIEMDGQKVINKKFMWQKMFWWCNMCKNYCNNPDNQEKSRVDVLKKSMRELRNDMDKSGNHLLVKEVRTFSWECQMSKMSYF